MITYVKGNLLESNAEALVNTVNTEGVMGKGLALQFREAFPANYRVYRDLCRNRRFHVGEMLITEESNLISGRKLIVNFPTKSSWRLPSEYTYIEKGLVALRREILRRQIRSIAIPPLGTHNGGLDWLRVKQMIESALSDLDCEIQLYEPSEVIVERMKSERVPLTPARAMVLVMFADLIANGEFASVFAAEKLIYFMQRFGAKEYFKIDFKPYIYGPYSGGKVSHILYHMNGSYIKGMGGMDNRPFDYIWLIDGAAAEADAFVRGHEDQQLLAICDQTKRFLTGYYSNYSLELLATVDYLLETAPSLKNWRNDNSDTVLNTLEQKIQEWSNRKSQMFHRSLLVTALDYLRESRMN